MRTRNNILAFLFFITTVIILFGSCENNSKNIDNGGEAAIRQTLYNFSQGLDNFKIDQFIEPFAENSTMFYPNKGANKLITGKENIRNYQIEKFKEAKERLFKLGKTEPPYLNLITKDLQIKLLGKNSAVASWHSPRENHIGRRTVILKFTGSKWRFIHFHASNLEYE